MAFRVIKISNKYSNENILMRIFITTFTQKPAIIHILHHGQNHFSVFLFISLYASAVVKQGKRKLLGTAATHIIFNTKLAFFTEVLLQSYFGY